MKAVLSEFRGEPSVCVDKAHTRVAAVWSSKFGPNQGGYLRTPNGEPRQRAPSGGIREEPAKGIYDVDPRVGVLMQNDETVQEGLKGSDETLGGLIHVLIIDAYGHEEFDKTSSLGVSHPTAERDTHRC